jgi:hypothetical protein
MQCAESTTVTPSFVEPSLKPPIFPVWVTETVNGCWPPILGTPASIRCLFAAVLPAISPAVIVCAIVRAGTLPITVSPLNVTVHTYPSPTVATVFTTVISPAPIPVNASNSVVNEPAVPSACPG